MTTTDGPGGDERGKLIRPEDQSWTRLTSIDDLLAAHPERVELLLDALDLDRAGLENVKSAVADGDRAAACRALLDYYAAEPRCRWILDEMPAPGERHVKVADNVLQNKVRRRGKAVAIPTHHGAWHWNHTGPKGNREFAYSLNRHAFFKDLLLAWQTTGNEAYARAFDRILRDWILHTVYPGKTHRYVWTWRVLEAGLRLRAWLPADRKSTRLNSSHYS